LNRREEKEKTKERERESEYIEKKITRNYRIIDRENEKKISKESVLSLISSIRMNS